MASPERKTVDIKVTVLLEQYPGEPWAASVPLIPGCLAEGTTPEEATNLIIPEIEYFILRHPDLIEELKYAPKTMVTEVDINLPSTTKVTEVEITRTDD